MGARKGIIAGVVAPLGVDGVEYVYGKAKVIFDRIKKEFNVDPVK
jgi:hypothetical protein